MNSSFLLEALAEGLCTTYWSFSLSSVVMNTKANNVGLCKSSFVSCSVWEDRDWKLSTHKQERTNSHRGKTGRWMLLVWAPCPCPSLSDLQSSAGQRAKLWFSTVKSLLCLMDDFSLSFSETLLWTSGLLLPCMLLTQQLELTCLIGLN